MTIKNYIYTKENGETSERTLYITKPAPKNLLCSAIVLSKVPEEQREKVVELYQTYLQEVEKPYKAALKEFNKEHAKTFTEYSKENGLELEIKNFISTNLKEV